jgi:hypothetical protein
MTSLLDPTAADILYVQRAVAGVAALITTAELFRGIDAMHERRARLRRLWREGDARISAACHATYERLTRRRLDGRPV